MINRLRRSRGYRKFKRDRLALFASSIIGVYFLVAILVWVFGLIPLSATKERVLPDLHPGAGVQSKLDKRVDAAIWYVKRAQTALDRAETRGSSARDLLDELALAERTVVDLDVPSIQKILDRGWEIYEGALEDVEEVEQHQDLLSEVKALEDVALEIQPMPTGFGGLVYRVRTCLGSDSQGTSISMKTLYSVKVAFQVGLVTAVIAVGIGTILGAAAAFWGGLVDTLVMWLVSTLSSIPYLVLLAVLIFMFEGSVFDNPEKPFLGLFKLYFAFGLTFWVGTCRVIRGEVLKIKELEYVQAAQAIGFGRFYIMMKHVVPNTAHLMFINFSLLFIGAIKSEVILSFLGLGVKGQPSWGIMIAHGKEDVQSFFFWQVLSATVAMFGLVLSFNVVSDALQDAFDPKHVD